MFGIFLAALMMQVFTGTTLILSQYEDLRFVGKIILVVGFCMFLLACLWIRYFVKKRSIPAVEGQESRYCRIQDEEAYKHPMDREGSY